MKVLVLTPNYPRKDATMNGVFIHQQIKALQDLGAECHVLLLRNWYPSFSLHKYHAYWREGYLQANNYFKEYEGVKIHSVPVMLKMPDRIFKNDFYKQAAKAVVKYIKRNKELHDADWLFAHFLSDYGYIASLVKREMGINVVAIALGDDVHAWPESNPHLVGNLKEVFKNADLILANSKGLAVDTAKWMDKEFVRQVEVVYNGVNTDKFYPANSQERIELKSKYQLDAGKKYLVCIATPVKAKGWVELLHAIRELYSDLEEWQLLMIAPNRVNNDALDLVSIAKELNIDDKVQLLGQLDPENVAEILRASDAFILPSYNEGMANALLEAMASGICCITTDVGGHKEVMNDRQSGILITPRSIDDIVCALKEVCNNAVFRKQLGENARNAMIKLGNYTENCKKLMSMLSNHTSTSK